MKRGRHRPGAGRRPEREHTAPARDQAVGILGKRGRLWVAEPFFARGRGIGVEPDRRFRAGQLVLARPDPRGRRRAKIVRALGSPDVARDVLEALLLDRGLRRAFPPGVERAAQEAVERVEPDAVARQDHRDRVTFTIDPATARDFDDAISAEALGADRWRVWVHIADVGAFVRPGSAVDREAYRRATSVYVPGLVEPMLPEVLSTHACSLIPGQERLAVTVTLDVEGDRVVRSSVARSRIRSDVRLDYDRVDRILAGEEAAQEPWAGPLAAARAAAAALRARRERAGALAVESAEPEFAFDRRGHVTGVRPAPQTESHRLVEHLMIAANEAVAELLADRAVPALFRIHERPEPAAVERLLAQLAALGVPTPPAPDPIPPQGAAALVAEASQLVAQEVVRRGHGTRALTGLVLRALKQARYSPENKGHAGLHSAAYCHFTSPIRRYPDLLCHRAVLSLVGGGEQAPRASVLGEAGDWTSGRERDAMTIERAADDVARAFLLERALHEGPEGFGRVFTGEVTGLVGAGAFLTLDDGFEGFLPVRRLRGDWWDLDELGVRLVAESGRVLRLGDPLEVRVRRVEPERGRVELDLATAR